MATKKKLKLYVTLNGFNTLIGEVKISKFAKERKPAFERTCPACSKAPKWTSGYTCECGATYNHWNKLNMVSGGKAVTKPRLPDAGDVTIYIVDENDFNAIDATANEYGLAVTDSNTAKNLKKLLTASRLLGKVLVLKWNDTFDQRVGILTTTSSLRVIIKEIVPLNLLEEKETLKIDFNIDDKDLQDAEAFVKMIGKSDENIETILTVTDYRTTGFAEAETAVEPIPKVKSLEELMASNA